MPGPLQQQVAQYKDANGVIQQTSQDDLQTLSGKAGLQAQPLSPVVAGQIGATPDQAKMAGTTQVQQSAQALSQLPPQQGLATAQREQQARSTATQQEQGEKAAAAQTSALGDTGTRVQSAIDAAVANLSAGSATPQNTTNAVNTSNALYQGADNQGQLTTDLGTLSQNPSDQNALMAVNADLGRNANSQLSPAELQGLYQDQNTTIAGQVASATPQAVTVAQLAAQPGFGYTLDNLGSMLGVPSATLANYTPAQLSTAVTAMQQQEFTKAATLTQQSTSPDLGVAERNTARQAGQEASATGVRASEDDVAKIQQSVANGDQVQFNGQTYTAEDLLGNAEISKTVAAYLAAPAGSPTQLALQQNEPQLVNYINQHQAVLTDAANAMSSGTTQLANTQTANASAATYGGQTLAPGAMSALIPGYDSTKIQGAVDTSKSPTLSYLATLPSDQQALAVQAINTLSPTQQAELATMTPDEISKLQLGKGSDSPVLAALNTQNILQAKLGSIDPNDADAVFSAFTGVPGTTAASLQAQVTADRQAATEGLTTYGTAGGLDTNRDGVLDDPATIYANMQKQASGNTLANAENGTNTGITNSTFTPYDSSTQTQVQAGLAAKLNPYTADGNLTVADLKSSGILSSPADLRNLVSTGMYNNMSASDKATVQKQVATYNNSDASALVAKDNGYNVSTEISKNPGNVVAMNNAATNVQGQINALQAALKANPGLASTSVAKQITTLQDQVKQFQAAAASDTANKNATAAAQAAAAQAAATSATNAANNRATTRSGTAATQSQTLGNAAAGNMTPLQYDPKTGKLVTVPIANTLPGQAVGAVQNAVKRIF